MARLLQTEFRLCFPVNAGGPVPFAVVFVLEPVGTLGSRYDAKPFRASLEGSMNEVPK